MTSRVTCQGELRTTWLHLCSGDEFNTDAPLENNGLGEAFSPTDTVARALSGSMLSMMRIKAKDLVVDLTGATAEVTKYMAAGPRRIAKIEVKLELASFVSNKNRKILERTAHTCPVHYDLHPHIEKEIQFQCIK